MTDKQPGDETKTAAAAPQIIHTSQTVVSDASAR